MGLNNESDVCESYINWANREYETEVTVGKGLIQEHTPRGLEGAKSPKADAVAWGNDRPPILVECKKSFDFTGIGQLILYSWFIQQNKLVDEEHSEVEQRLVLGEKPHGVLLKACDDLGIDVVAHIGGKWHTNFSIESDKSDNITPSKVNEIVGWLEQSTSSGADADSEDELISDTVKNKLEDIILENVYYELPVGYKVFSNTKPSFKADAIGHAPQENVYYVIEAKYKADIQQFCKAIGQALAYSSLFRHSFELPVKQILPTVLLRYAPLHAKIYRDQYSHMKEMMEDAVFQPDRFLLFYDNIEIFK